MESAEGEHSYNIYLLLSNSISTVFIARSCFSTTLFIFIEFSFLLNWQNYFKCINWKRHGDSISALYEPPVRIQYIAYGISKLSNCQSKSGISRGKKYDFVNLVYVGIYCTCCQSRESTYTYRILCMYPIYRRN